MTKPMTAERRAEIRADKYAMETAEVVELLAEVDRLRALWADVAKISRDRKAEADGRRQHAEKLKAKLATRDSQLRLQRAEIERAHAVEAQAVDYVDDLNQQIAEETRRAEKAEAERDQALVDLETAKGWRDAAIVERDQLRREVRDYRRANTTFQEINTIRTAERDQLKAAAQAEFDRHDAEIKELQEEQRSEAQAALKNINRWRAEIRDAEAKVASLLHDMTTVARDLDDGAYGDAIQTARIAIGIGPLEDIPADLNQPAPAAG